MSDGISETRFTRHGAVRVAASGTHLEHEDGTPFLFLADTAWSGAILASEADWEAYLADRVAQGFTAVQFIAHAPWSAALTDEAGHRAFAARGDAPVSAAERASFFERLRRRTEAVVDAGLLPVPVLAWAANFGFAGRLNPGVALGMNDLEALIRAEMECFDGLPTLLLFAGDGKYGGLRSWKWRRLAKRLFGPAPHPPIGLHPMGMTWPYRSFAKCEWLDVVGYQSGHSDADATLRWLLNGPPATAWRQTRKPFINLEPCYEGIRNWGGGGVFTNGPVRRALYESLLNAPTAGVTYGAHGVWSWESELREPLNHAGTGVALSWRQAIKLPGSADVRRLAEVFGGIRWWTLRPAGALINQPAGHLRKFISCSASPDRDLIVCYLPQEADAVEFRDVVSGGEWYEPSTGKRRPHGGVKVLVAPSKNDWLLIVKSTADGSAIA